MSAMIIGVVLLLLIGLSVGIYFLVNAKTCEDHETHDECKKPCQWDTYGYKCIGEKDAMTPKPPSVPAPTEPNTSARTSGSAPDGPVSFTVPTKTIELADIDEDTTRGDAPLSECHMARYNDLRTAWYKNPTPLADSQRHYINHTLNGPENRNFTCYMTDSEAQCYIDRYPDVKEYVEGKEKYKLDKARKHYYEIGHAEGRDFSCSPSIRELTCYLARYPDLQSTYVKSGVVDWYGLRHHWNATGRTENRKVLCDDAPRNSNIN
jgi:hypothetical protein